MTNRLRPTTAEVQSTEPVAQYRGQIYTQSIGARFDGGVSCTVFHDGPTLSESERLSAVVLIGFGGTFRARHPSGQPYGISPDEGGGDWAHEVTGEVAHVEDDGRIGIAVDDVPVRIDLRSSTGASESSVESLDCGDDVTVFAPRLDLRLVE